MSIDIWANEIQTQNMNESFPTILQQVCNNLQHILLENDDYNDIEYTNICITYKIKKKKKSKRMKLQNLGSYQKIKTSEIHKTCSICLDNFKEGKFKRKMPKCIHEFHKTCIDHWLYKDIKYSCPVCRTFQGN